MLTDVMTHVMVVTDSMVHVILDVNPDGRDMTVKMVLEMLYIYYVLFLPLAESHLLSM